MNTRIVSGLLALAGAMAVSIAFAGGPHVQIEALFTDTAVLKIDGERKMLRVGQTHHGVTLVSAEAESATIQVGGKKQVLGLSRHIGSDYEEPKEQVVTIPKDAQQQYQTSAMIDGVQVLVLVDTGANVVAMSSSRADKLGVSYKGGTRTAVETASGVAPAYSVTLSSVNVGGIQVNNVPALVVKGDYPRTVLLGMSFLRHVKLEEHRGVLSLSRTP
ncbi:MAG: aspartyl protease family protein [Halioglobus sp.]|jgi:aspartyl protease family protein